jgi:hypothetical protein
MLRTGQSPPFKEVSSLRFDDGIPQAAGSQLPGTLASPRTGLAPAGCRELVARLRHAPPFGRITAPELLEAHVMVTISMSMSSTDRRICGPTGERSGEGSGDRSGDPHDQLAPALTSLQKVDPVRRLAEGDHPDLGRHQSVTPPLVRELP